MGTFPAGAHSTTSEMSRLARGLMEAATAPQLGDSTVVNGAILSRDEDMVERARFGRLTDGTHGVTGRIVGSTISGGEINGTVVRTQHLIIEDGAGNELPLTQLMGQKAGKNAAVLTMGSGGTIAANAWFYDTALNQSVVVANGRLAVTVSARLMVTVGKGDLTAGYRITGPTAVAATRDVGLQCYYNLAGMDQIQQGSWADLVDGLAPGAYTVCPAYYLGSIGSPAAYGEVSRRAINVMPY